MPGMRTLAQAFCEACGGEFFVDLPAGGGLYYPMLLDRYRETVHDRFAVPWFADWLRRSYAHRVDRPAALDVEVRRKVRRPLLLNCLDRLYGHCVLKLLNAQRHIDRHPGHDLIVLVPRFLRWMVPDGVAEIWTIDHSLHLGTAWNDWLDAEIHRRLAPFPEAWLSIALPHPHPGDFAIERFTRVAPFQLDGWDDGLATPVVTFVWRDDRSWTPMGHNLASGTLPTIAAVSTFERNLRRIWPSIDFAVAGVGEPIGLPPSITDLRVPHAHLTSDRECALCRRYAASHVVVGVHGSHLLLPSAHAGASFSLTPSDRWRNALQDLLPQQSDARETAFRYRALPVSVTAEELASVTTSVLAELTAFRRRMSPPWSRPGGGVNSRRDRICITAPV
jgi:hypothetical protein